MIPLRIEVFMWYLRKGVVLTKDNLGRRNWQGDKRCVFVHAMNDSTFIL
jgi:hypothetical protein